MAAGFFISQPFTTTGTLAGAPSFFYGNNVDNIFVVSNGSVLNIASTIEYSATQLNLYNGGFAKDVADNSVVLATIPPGGTQGIIPAGQGVTFSSYDTPIAGNSTTANVDEQYIYFGDIDEIDLYGYRPQLGQANIQISFANAITGLSFDTTMLQLACCHSDGTAFTYAATGTPIQTPSLDQFGTLGASAAAGSNTLICSTASSFIPGDFIYFNKNQVNQEIVRFDFATGTTMNFTTQFNYNHAANEPIYACMRQFKGKQTIPSGLTGGVAANFLNIYLQAPCSQYRRL